ncbi:putative mitochondrial L-2-hydroxyglutarate dehydrogenase [Cladorrhinum sp. PSN259]|nr:putative mitochondrial L-2-hydroxyglutarate dehydrogenase [Cladorrhinum sp. PSN259]
MRLSNINIRPLLRSMASAKLAAKTSRYQLPTLISPLSRHFSSTPSPQQSLDFDHVIIGGGVVGLAIAQELSQRGGPNTSTLLLERHGAIGTETSSRNSEVIHAGIYYGAGSLKTKLCIEGKEKIYALCKKHQIPHRNTGKWIVAQNETQLLALQQIHDFCTNQIHVPVHFLSRDEISRREPFVRAEAGVLESPTTGIIDSHSYMLCLLGLFEDAGGTLALTSSVEGISPISTSGTTGSSGWTLTVRDTTTSETSSITTSTIINSAGLDAIKIHNLIIPDKSKHLKPYYAKGNYFSYPASSPSVNTLIYPAPEPGHGGLGTHLTMDLAGRIKFGPDVEWVDDPSDLSVNTSRLSETVKEVKKYLPDLDENQLQPDYAGIRPKLGKAGAVAHGKGFLDFVIRKEEGHEGWINLLGIESPGLTSSLAIAEKVRGLLYG